MLRPLSDAGINLTKIESRPAATEGHAWEYVFFLELDGHAAEEPLAAALAELETRCPLFRVLGSYAKVP